jgi:AraC family transcriptional regulator
VSFQQEVTAHQPAQHRAAHPGEFVQLSSRMMGWNGIVLEQLKFPALDISEVCAAQHHLTLQLKTIPTAEVKVNGKFESRRLFPGSICITPARQHHAVRWQGDMDVLTLSLDPQFMIQAVHESVNLEHAKLMIHHRGHKDPLVQQIFLALKSELKAGCPSGTLYGEAMGTALAVHLLTHYSTVRSSLKAYEGGLAKHQLDQVLDYIQTYLDQDIKLTELAELVDMSQYHFCRLFKQSTGVPPHQFVLQQRIERAKQLLQQKNFAIAEIALSCGFKSQSHFTTLFRKFTGSTPKAFRNS